ncbi:mitochondrial pyruvate carrier 3 [[Candida] anglica]|uniref:Mitochondrial pyruvate carrier n=1 Tax=[Candida] anglica TaxID=148631 RepID=A0ABP0EIA7_9ASCO
MAATAQHASKFTRYLNSETGPKTVHFWAPVLKWALVIAGINDLQRPVEKISGTQQAALFCTGAIWTRWAGFVIKPRNMLLASVNFFLGGVASYQIYRIVDYRRAAGDSPGQVFKYIVNGSTDATGEAPARVEPVAEN